MRNLKLIPLMISLLTHVVDPATNVTGDSGMTVEMKTYYDKLLLKNAWPKLVHNQFGQKRNIPKGGGKIIEFRKFTPLPKALTPLSEGVTPNGQKIAATSINATIAQYGAYVTYSDILSMTTIDPVLVEGMKLLGHQAGMTLDTITREVLNGGDTVQYGDGSKSNRASLVGLHATWASNDYFNCEMIRRANLTLRNNKATPLEGGDFVCIIHPEAEYCLKKDSEWVSYQLSQNAQKIFDGEIGRFDGTRFVVSTEAKIFAPPDLAAAGRNLTIASLNTKTFTVDEVLTAADKASMEGREISVKGQRLTVATVTAGAAGAATILVSEDVTTTPGDGDIIYPADMGAGEVSMPLNGAEVSSALFIASDAYGTTIVEGLGLQTIVKPLGSGEDPLNQRSTAGWKSVHVAKRLSELWMVRVEFTIPDVLGEN